MSLTRGYGLLENYLAKKRTKITNRHITLGMHRGRVLDIGCGSSPYFLEQSCFKEKHGIDAAPVVLLWNKPIKITKQDLSTNSILPFEDNYFDAVTMLAVLEHFEKGCNVLVVREIYRVLKPSGVFIMTTPAKWSSWILKIMASVGLVSDIEIRDHKEAYDHARIKSILRNAGFKDANVTCGYFEFFLNLWATAKKSN